MDSLSACEVESKREHNKNSMVYGRYRFSLYVGVVKPRKLIKTAAKIMRPETACILKCFRPMQALLTSMLNGMNS